MTQLITELLSAKGRHSRMLKTGDAESAINTQRAYGTLGWLRLARLSLAVQNAGVEAFDPLVVLCTGVVGARKLARAVVPSLEAWAYEGNVVPPYTLAIVGSRYLSALAGLRGCSSMTECTEREQGLPPATDVYLGPCQTYINRDVVAVELESRDLVTVTALGAAIVRLDYAGPND